LPVSLEITAYLSKSSCFGKHINESFYTVIDHLIGDPANYNL